MFTSDCNMLILPVEEARDSDPAWISTSTSGTSLHWTQQILFKGYYCMMTSLLQLPESFSVLFSCENLSYCFKNSMNQNEISSSRYMYSIHCLLKWCQSKSRLSTSTARNFRMLIFTQGWWFRLFCPPKVGFTFKLGTALGNVDKFLTVVFHTR